MRLLCDFSSAPAGRDFTIHDDSESQPMATVNLEFCRRDWPFAPGLIHSEGTIGGCRFHCAGSIGTA